MRILSIRLKNFMNISEADLTFQKGLNVLHGMNGQGKSSVLEAIAFCIVGRTRGPSWKNFVKTGEDSFSIHLEMIKSSEEDVIVFDYKGDLNSSTMDKKVSYKGIEKTGEGANKFVEELFDIKMMENTVFSMQDANKVSALKPAEIRELLKKIFNSDFPDIVEKIEQDSKEAKAEEQMVSAKIEVLKGVKYNYYENILDPDPTRITALNSELETVKANEVVRQKYKFFQGKKQDLANLHTRLKDLQDKKDLAFMKKETLSAQEPQLIKEKTDLKVTLRAEVLKLEQLEDNLKILQDELTPLVNKKVEFDTSWKKEEEELLAPIRSNHTSEAEYRGLITIAEKHIEAHRRGECIECGQKTSVSNIPLYEEEIAGYNALIVELRKNNETINEKIKNQREKAKAIDAEVLSKVNEIEEVKRKVASSEKTISKIESDIKLRDHEYTSLADKIQSAQEKVDDLGKDIDSLTLEIGVLDQWCSANSVEPPETEARPYEVIQREIEEVVAGIQLAKTQREQNVLTKEKEAKDKADIVLLTDTLNTYQLKIKGLKELKSIFDSAFPNFISLKACSILQNFMNNFFEDIKNKFEIKLDQSTKGIDILYRANEEKEWRISRMASGMESALLSLGFKVAVASAYGNDLILLDEPDASCDDSASEKLFKVVSGIDKFEQMFIITHRAPAMNYLRDNGALVYTVQNGEFSMAG